MDNRPRKPVYRISGSGVDGFINSSPQRKLNIKLKQTSTSATSMPVFPKKVPVTQPEVPNNTPLPPTNVSTDKQDVVAVPKKNRHSKKHKEKKWSRKRKVLTLVAVIVLALIGFGGWDVWQLEHKVNHLEVGNLTQSVAGAENILVAGSTNRCNLKVQNAQWGFCSDGVTGVNSDIIFIVHIVPKTKTVSILSIPRDIFVPNAREGNQAFKIDAALYQGPTQLVNAIQEDFGIPIQHYAEVGFDGFVNIVNAVGGIKMDFPDPVYDSESYLNIKTPGCKTLNGVEALQVVRARHLQYDPPTLKTTNVNLWPQEIESDIARIARTHEFLRVLGSTVAAQGLGNPVTDQKLIDAIAPQVQVDSGLSTSAMLELAQELHSVNVNNIQQLTLPISTTNFGSYVWAGNNFGDVAFPSESSDQQIINQFLGTNNSTDTMTGKPLPNPSSVAVNVINGSGTANEASQVTSSLLSLGFDTVGQPTTTTAKSSEAVETVVNYANPNTEADAEAVARELTGPVILSQNASMVSSGSEVTVLAGTGLAVNVPANSKSTGSLAASQTTNTTSTSSATSTNAAATGLEPASSATQGLSAWDPRACTANQPVESY